MLPEIHHHFLYHDNEHGMLCFTPFCIMTENRMLLPHLHTEKNHLFVEELTNYFYNLSTIWENTYDYTENYIFSTALYLLSNFLQAYNKLLTVMSVHQDMPDRWLTASTQQNLFFFS